MNQFRNPLYIKYNGGESHRRSDRVANTYNRLAASYDAHFDTDLPLAENIFVFKQLDRICKEDDSILDLGCGTGLLLEYMLLHPGQYLGIDISNGMLEQARTKFAAFRFQQMDMCDLSQIRSNSYHRCISLFNAFSYVEFPLKALQEMYRVLKPGGSIYLMAGSERYPSRPSYIANQEGIYSDLAGMSAGLFKRLAREAGFSHVRLRGMNAYAEKLFANRDRDFIASYLEIESAFIGRFWPNSCYFLILEAQKLE